MYRSLPSSAEDDVLATYPEKSVWGNGGDLQSMGSQGEYGWAMLLSPVILYCIHPANQKRHFHENFMIPHDHMTTGHRKSSVSFFIIIIILCGFRLHVCSPH